MTETEVILRFGVALSTGLGIGIERGASHRGVSDDSRVAGVRTFALLALIGAGCGLSTAFAGPWLLAGVGVGVMAFLIAGYSAQQSRSRDLGLTTEMAAVVTFVAGALSGAGFPFATVLIGAATIILLHNKPTLHALTEHIARDEISAGVKVLVIAALAVPLAPNEGFGPGGALNPRELAMALVVIAALGLAGYAAMRIARGSVGFLAFGFAGGLVSSTGVAISAARLARDSPSDVGRLAAASSVAQSVMFARTGILAGALNPSLLPSLGWALGAGLISAAFGAWVLMKPVAHAPDHAMALGSPDTLNAAARFVVVAAGVVMVSALLIDWFGVWALYLSGFVSGLVDVDAATVSASRLSDGAPAAYAVILALCANAASKTALSWQLGGREMGLKTGYALMGSVLAATLAFASALALV